MNEDIVLRCLDDNKPHWTAWVQKESQIVWNIFTLFRGQIGPKKLSFLSNTVAKELNIWGTIDG